MDNLGKFLFTLLITIVVLLFVITIIDLSTSTKQERVEIDGKMFSRHLGAIKELTLDRLFNLAQKLPIAVKKDSYIVRAISRSIKWT